MKRLVAALWLLAATPCLAGDRFAVVITGASGGDAYAEKYDGWRTEFVKTLQERLGFDADHVFVLAESPSADVRPATKTEVQRLFGDLRKRLKSDDLLFVLLIGHGAPFDNEDAKFNLVGPDASASEWADLLRPLPGRLIFVDTTAASFPFMAKLAGRDRIILTATDSAQQQFETVFPDYFVTAFEDDAADADKNGRVSLWEAFTFASAGVRQWYDQHAQLPTERPLLDDDGDGIGREAQAPGTDGALARRTYLDADAGVATGDASLSALLRKRADLEARIEQLKDRKSESVPEEYDKELERLLTELARLAQEIKAKSKS